MQNCHTILFYLPIIQLTVYKRTITRFIADDKVAYQRVRRATRLASDNSWARRRLKHVSWRSRWIILCTFEWEMPVSCEISRADRCLFWLVLLTLWAQDPPLLYAECGLDNGFSSADCQCFQVSNPCQETHSTAFMHRIPLTDRDFKIRIAAFCEMMLFNFYWYLGLDSFPRWST